MQQLGLGKALQLVAVMKHRCNKERANTKLLHNQVDNGVLEKEWLSSSSGRVGGGE